MYIPSKLDILKLIYRYPQYYSHLILRKIAFYNRYRWALANSVLDSKVPLPLAFKLYLTLKCNIRCNMCMLWGEKGVLKNETNEAVFEELDWEIVTRIFQQIKDYHPALSFILSGGEPMLYSRFGDLAGLFKKHKRFAYVVTNGMLLDKFIDAVEDNPYMILYVSLDGLKCENDMLRGQGVFDKVVENIKLIKSLKKPPFVGIQFTLQPENVGSIYDTCKKMVALGADWFFINLRWYITDKQAEKYEGELRDKFGISPTSHLGFKGQYPLDKEKFVEQCKKLKREKWPIQISSYLKSPEDIYVYMDRPEEHPYNNFCYKEWARMDVLSNGDVTPCIQFPDITFGNLKEKPVAEIWNSAEFANFRQFVRKQLFSVCSKCYATYLYDGGRLYF